jgi:hypothetical protein
MQIMQEQLSSLAKVPYAAHNTRQTSAGKAEKQRKHYVVLSR